MCSLHQSDVEQLESVQRGILRIQCLPDTVAIIAIYGLLGIRPIEQELDIRKLSLFATVMFDEASPEHEIAQRQLAVKDINSDSWFMQCNLLLHKYGLSNAYLIKDSFHTNGAFKEAISRGVDKYVQQQWHEDAKSTLRYLNIDHSKVGSVHNVWKLTSHSTRDVLRAQIKIKLLTGSYILQSRRSKFSISATSDTCLLCKVAPEDLKHFLLDCSCLQSVMSTCIHVIQRICLRVVPDHAVQLLTNKEWLCCIIMDCTILADEVSGDLWEGFVNDMETVSRNLCFALHLKRTTLLREHN